MVEFFTDGPGPGSYTLQSTFGAAPKMPTARHGGAFSFCQRPEARAFSECETFGEEKERKRIFQRDLSFWDLSKVSSILT